MSEDHARRLEIQLSDPANVAKLLERACGLVDEVQYALIASRDGLIVAASANSDNDRGSDEAVGLRGAVLAASAAAVGDHFARLSSQGRPRSALFEADRGCVGVFPISSTLLLVVMSAQSVSLGRFGAAAKRVTSFLQAPES